MDYNKLRLLNEIQISYMSFPMKINYIMQDGQKFTNELEAVLHDEKLSRVAYYEHLLANRNWFYKFFNIKPSMKFYDKIQLKVTLNRRKNE